VYRSAETNEMKITDTAALVTGAEQHLKSVGSGSIHQPLGFISASAVTFIVSVATTVYFCRSMCCELEMPGGWTMSMMWMRMPGQTWFPSAKEFLLMWLAMMVAMMLPSALPMFLSARRSLAETGATNSRAAMSLMVSGYFATWMAAGAGVYALGIAFAATVMRWESFSRAVPVLSGVALIAAGAFQFTNCKMTGLLRCRSPLGCGTSCPVRGTSFLLGCKQGAACCVCCTAPMMIMIVLGMMNPLVMIVVAIVIAAEKLLPRPEIVARLVGLATIITGIAIISEKLPIK
jgi:predicted metal-binding membrane protein